MNEHNHSCVWENEEAFSSLVFAVVHLSENIPIYSPGRECTTCLNCDFSCKRQNQDRTGNWVKLKSTTTCGLIPVWCANIDVQDSPFCQSAECGSVKGVQRAAEKSALRNLEVLPVERFPSASFGTDSFRDTWISVVHSMSTCKPELMSEGITEVRVPDTFPF